MLILLADVFVQILTHTHTHTHTLTHQNSVGGAVMVSLSPSGIPQEDSDKKFNYGALYALGGAGL